MLLEAPLVVAGAAMIAATALPLLRRKVWWIRWFDFPRLQILVVLGVVCAMYLPFGGAVWSDVFMAALAASCAYQSYMMFPYTVLGRRQVEQSRRATRDSTARLLFANVLMKNRDSARLKAMIAETAPDSAGRSRQPSRASATPSC